MRLLTTYPTAEPLRVTPQQLRRMGLWLQQEIEDAHGARAQQESLWRELLRMYEGVPKNPVRNTPIENVPNIEVTLGAIATDSIFSQMMDLIYTISPLLTCRAIDQRWTKHMKAMQRFVNHVVTIEAKMRAASEHSIMDNCQLGTGVYYTPWVEDIQKAHSHKIVNRGPRILSIPAEDFLTPGGAYDDLQLMRWVAARFWYTEEELNLRAKFRGWDISNAAVAGAKDWVRTRRETLGRTLANITRHANLYEIYDIYAFFDIDEDGFDEDLLITWDRTSHSVLRVRYNPYDYRPFSMMRYQIRAHLAQGIGVMEMTKPYQDELVELHMHQLINVMLSNARMYKTKTGNVPEGTIAVWPNRNFEVTNPEDITEMKLSDIYPSLPQTQAMVISLAERRTGVNDMSLPRPSQVLGSRTPGITALSMLQQVNKRFTAAFDGVRLATAEAAFQCLIRYQERVRDGDAEVEFHILQLLGDDPEADDGGLVLEILRRADLEKAMTVELTASSASINRDADRQNAVMLVNLLANYYQKTLELVGIASNPQTPAPVRDVAKKIAESAGEIIDRTIRTFDQIRDPATFIIDVERELDQNAGQLDQNGLSMLQSMMQGQGQPVPTGLPPGMA